MATVQENLEPAQLISRMNAIRNVSEVHVADLHQEVQRLGDWREHVRGNPLVAMTAAAATGYVLSRQVFGGKRKPAREAPRPATQSETTTAAVSAASLSSGVMALVGSLASTLIRQYAMQTIQSKFGGHAHDRYPSRNSTTAGSE